MKKTLLLVISALLTFSAHASDSDKMVQQHMYGAQSKVTPTPTPTPAPNNKIKMHKKTGPYSDIKMHKKESIKMGKPGKTISK